MRRDPPAPGPLLGEVDAPPARPRHGWRALFADPEHDPDQLHRAPGHVRLFRYTAGSGVAALTSEVAFVVVFGVAHAPAFVATVSAFLAGAIPNWVLNRRWAWSRNDRVDVRREVVPYAVIVLGALAITTAATSLASALASGLSHWAAVCVVDGTFVLVTGGLFVAKFLLFDRVFFPARARA